MRTPVVALFIALIYSSAFGASGSASPADERDKPSPKRNFLAEITALTAEQAETAAKEHAFFERLGKEGGHEDLLESLGVITSTDAQTSRIGIPGGGSRPVEDADLTWDWVRYKLKRLRWQSGLGEGDD